LRRGGILPGPSCPSVAQGVASRNPEVTDVDLSLGRELAGLALLVGLLSSVMWLLAKTRRAPRKPPSV
jgi:hypothetical protein